MEAGYETAVVESGKQLEALRESTVAALSRGMICALAVTEMRRRFINSGHSSPFFWAPFVYYGRE